MSDIAIRAENLGKRYRIGSEKEQYGMLRDILVGAVKSPLRRRRGQAPEVSEFWALRDASFELKQGEVLGVIGHNGAGKSTLLKILSRITEPTIGRAEIHGRVGSLLEVGTGFHPELTGRENIYLNGAVIGMSKRDIDLRFDEMVAFAEIDKFLDTPVKRYSSGMYTRLAFSVAAHLEPEVLIVDEVLSVGDVAFQQKSLGKMGDVAKEGRTVLFVSHKMAAVRALCQRVAMLDHGKVVRIGDSGTVVDKYLSDIHTSVETRNDAFPAMNSQMGIGIKSCSAEVDIEPGETRRQRLTVVVDVIATRPHRTIGIGIALTAADGTRATILGPALTGFILDRVENERRCRFVCEDIGTFLAGGEYTIEIWLDKPRVERLIRVENAIKFVIRPTDLYSTGMFFESHRNGVVPLPMRFETDDAEIAAVEQDDGLLRTRMRTEGTFS
ncbi:MAG TPA: polysaccharide ABC transporter ATP-binding protein [Nitrolancea sp.]|nr:polysaccharide ABC transporter ATP-binding protein [Nitrolancea sp.]